MVVTEHQVKSQLVGERCALESGCRGGGGRFSEWTGRRAEQRGGACPEPRPPT